jgi:hypothetical protein
MQSPTLSAIQSPKSQPCNLLHFSLISLSHGQLDMHSSISLGTSSSCTFSPTPVHSLLYHPIPNSMHASLSPNFIIIFPTRRICRPPFSPLPPCTTNTLSRKLWFFSHFLFTFQVIVTFSPGFKLLLTEGTNCNRHIFFFFLWEVWHISGGHSSDAKAHIWGSK